MSYGADKYQQGPDDKEKWRFIGKVWDKNPQRCQKGHWVEVNFGRLKWHLQCTQNAGHEGVHTAGFEFEKFEAGKPYPGKRQKYFNRPQGYKREQKGFGKLPGSRKAYNPYMEDGVDYSPTTFVKGALGQTSGDPADRERNPHLYRPAPSIQDRLDEEVPF